VSVDGDNPKCDDPFHNNYTAAILESPCLGGRKGRNGLFPATACIKLAGVYGKKKPTSSRKLAKSSWGILKPHWN